MFKTLVIAAAVSASAAVALAQTQNPAPVVKQNVVKATLTITAIDQAKRSVTLKSANGDEDTYTVGPAVQRFNQLKVGDKINATYQESLVFEVRKQGATGTAGGTTAAAERYKNQVGGAIGAAHTTTVTVKAVNMTEPSITVVTADGHAMTTKIQDKKNLEGVKPGDRIDITYSEALIMTADPAK